MTTLKKTAPIGIEDPVARKKAIEECLMELDARATSLGEPQIPISLIQGRYELSCWIILLSNALATALLLIASVYFTTLPRPYSYLTTQEGVLHEIKPVKID